MSDARPIGVFDSGIGGLTVVNELFKRLPNESIVYFGDTARVPYGSKSPHVVRRFANQDVQFLMRHDVKLIVVACHTASSIAIDSLKRIFDIPILGVVEPGIQGALNCSKTKRVGLVGTKATVSSERYNTRFHAIDSNVKLFTQACPLFVPLVEEGWLSHDVTRSIAEIYLDPLKKENIDALILGCTHYPLLKSLIRDVMGEDVAIIDSAEETAKAVEQALTEKNAESDEFNSEHHFYVSDIPYQFQEIGERFLGRPILNLERVDVDGLIPVQEKL